MINYGLTCYSFPATVTVAIKAKSSSVGTGKLLFFSPFWKLLTIIILLLENMSVLNRIIK